jgi:hypothetical protein
MMKTIYKYPLLFTDTQEIQLPAGAQVLTAQLQSTYGSEQLVLWALVDPLPGLGEAGPKRAITRRRIAVVGTGNPMPPSNKAWRYVSTIQLAGQRPLVFHIFEEPA